MKSINWSNQEYGRFSLISLIFLAAIIPLTWLLGWEGESAVAAMGGNPEGIYEVRQVANLNQASFGSFSINNSDSETMLVASLVDLIISPDITLLSPTPINPGDPVSFRVTVTNTGDTGAVNQFPVSIYFNPSPPPISSSTHISNVFKVASAAINGLSSGSSQVVTLTAFIGFPITGTNTVYGVVDSDPPPVGQIDETNETNNISNVLNVNVEAPEFTIYFPAVFGKP